MVPAGVNKGVCSPSLPHSRAAAAFLSMDPQVRTLGFPHLPAQIQISNCLLLPELYLLLVLDETAANIPVPAGALAQLLGSLQDVLEHFCAGKMEQQFPDRSEGHTFRGSTTGGK